MDLMGGVQWTPLKDAIFATGAEKSPELYQRLKDTIASPLTVFPVGFTSSKKFLITAIKPSATMTSFAIMGCRFFFSPPAAPPATTPQGMSPAPCTTNAWPPRSNGSGASSPSSIRTRHPTAFNAQHVEFADEVASFRRIVDQASHEDTLIPGTSRWSLYKLRQDAEWLRGVDSSVPTPQQLDRLERISIRVQCLLANYSGCFTF